MTHLDETNFRIVAAYWEVTWRFACPFLLFSVMVASLVNLQKGTKDFIWLTIFQVDYTPASEGEYQFPLWANAIGWCIALSSVLAVLPASALEVFLGKAFRCSLVYLYSGGQSNSERSSSIISFPSRLQLEE